MRSVAVKKIKMSDSPSRYDKVEFKDRVAIQSLSDEYDAVPHLIDESK